MPPILTRLRQGIPDRFLASIAVGLAFVVFLTFDQAHWWRLKPDYAFGWLVPIFVAFIVFERWPKLRSICSAAEPSRMPSALRWAVSGAAGLLLGLGLVFFLLGAVYKAGSGITQPGSFALAAGFACTLIGMVYFNVPDGQLGGGPPAQGWRSIRTDARLQAAGLFLFPAFIWMLSAPLVSAVESSVSLFLLRKVVTVVFTVFSMLGYPLVQEGNVLILPHGQVGVADACSGIRSLTGCLFAGSFLAAVFLDRFWKKATLVVAAMFLAFFTNLLRSLFLTGWAYAYGSDAIEGRLHDSTGFAVLGLTSLGLLGLVPLFRRSTWAGWLGLNQRQSIPNVR